MRRRVACWVGCWAIGSWALGTSASCAAQLEPLQVFILAGQSNMEGKAKMSLLNFQAEDPRFRDAYAHLREQGAWRVRDDVWIRFNERHGPLTVGYGSPECIGPELEFGFVMGERLAAPVLLIKTAWGGRSLYRDFRSPSAGLPPPEVIAKMVAAANQQPHPNRPEATSHDIEQSFGASYREMLAVIRETVDSRESYVPGSGQRPVRLAGFLWFQGWNDMINEEYTAAYSVNLAHLIRDVRRDLQCPDLPWVVVQMGVEGNEPSPSIARFKQAQAAVTELDEFRNNVRLVRSDQFWDQDAAAVFRRGWKENLEDWNQVGSDYPYHYLGSGRTMIGIGRATAEAMWELQPQ